MTKCGITFLLIAFLFSNVSSDLISMDEETIKQLQEAIDEVEAGSKKLPRNPTKEEKESLGEAVNDYAFELYDVEMLLEEAISDNPDDTKLKEIEVKFRKTLEDFEATWAEVLETSSEEVDQELVEKLADKLDEDDESSEKKKTRAIFPVLKLAKYGFKVARLVRLARLGKKVHTVVKIAKKVVKVAEKVNKVKNKVSRARNKLEKLVDQIQQNKEQANQEEQ